MRLEDIDETNFFVAAAKHYDIESCLHDGEFFEDLNRIKWIKRAIRKFINREILRERIILNHIQILCNMFGSELTVRMLLLKLEGFEEYLGPFFKHLGILPKEPYKIGFNKRIVDFNQIEFNEEITQLLETI